MNKYLNLNKSFINGIWVDGKESKSIDLTNPYNDDILAKTHLASLDQINEAFAGAKAAQKTWGKDAAKRKQVMTTALEYFKDNQKEISELLTLESGSTQVKAKLEVDLTIGIMAEAIDMVDEIGKFDEKNRLFLIK